MAARHEDDFHVEELKEYGGSSVAVNHPHGVIDAHIGTPEYISTHSYAYENPGLIEHIASSMPDSKMIAYINNISVDPGWRGKKLGSALMKRMLQELKARGARYVYGHMAEWKGHPKRRLEHWLAKFGFQVVNCCQEDLLPVVAVTLA